MWSSTNDSLSKKGMLLKNMLTGEIYGVNKTLDYYLYDFKKIQVNSVCIKKVEEKWDIEEEISELKKNLLKSNY